MLWLKGCTKCNGDLVLADDGYEVVIECLQCGRQLTNVQQDELRRGQRVRVAA